MNVMVPDDKQKAILMAAWAQFSAYGFRKTSMDDIARAAEMSRPALYLHYRNKVDIYRSLVQYYYDETADRLAETLTLANDPASTLKAAFEAQGDMIIDVMLNSPHGRELMDSSSTEASEIIDEGEAIISAIYADWLRRGAEAGRLSFEGEADDVARAMTAALKGIKVSARDAASYLSGIRQLAALFGSGLAK